MNTKWGGVIPPLVTPFKPGGRDIDFDALDRVIDRQTAAGVHGLFALGSTGEVAYLTDEQRGQVVERVAGRAKGTPVYAGCIETTNARVVDQARRMANAGADAIVVTAPIYARNNVRETEAHFRAIHEASPLPIVAYDIPVRVNSKLDVDMLLRLATDGVIVAVKDSSGDGVSFRRLVQGNAECGNPMSVMTGGEAVVDGSLLLGADGVVPGLGNVDPVGYVRLWDLAKQGDWEQVRLEQDRIASLFEIVFQASDRSPDAAGVGAFKVAMQHLGVLSNAEMAYPVESLDAAAVKAVEDIVDRFLSTR